MTACLQHVEHSRTQSLPILLYSFGVTKKKATVIGWWPLCTARALLLQDREDDDVHVVLDPHRDVRLLRCVCLRGHRHQPLGVQWQGQCVSRLY